MTFLQALRQAIRDFLVARETAFVVNDIINNGLSPEDELAIDAYLAQTMP